MDVVNLETIAGESDPLARDWRIRGLSIATAVVFVVGIVAAVVVSGSEASSEPDADDVALVSLASQRLDEVSSCRMEMRFDVGAETTTMRMEFASQTLGRMTLQARGQTIEMFTDGQRLYAPAARGSSEWILFESAQAFDPEQAAGLVGNDPLTYLDALAGDADIEVLGTEKVRDVVATRYRAETTFERLNAQTPEEFRDPELEAVIDQLPKSLALDLWVSEDGLLRRMDFEFEVEGITSRVEMELFDFGAPVEVVLPAPESVIETRTAATFVELRDSFGFHMVTLIEL